MTDEKKKELFSHFAYIYSVKKNPNKYGKDTFEEWASKIKEDKPWIEELAKAAAIESDEMNAYWDEAEKLATTSQVQSAKNGAKLENLKKLQSVKKKVTKKCKCGCEMVDMKEEGGKITSKCACNCGGGKVGMKSKGGVLFEDDLSFLTDRGVIDSSISNKWERKIKAHKLGKFKK